MAIRITKQEYEEQFGTAPKAFPSTTESSGVDSGVAPQTSPTQTQGQTIQPQEQTEGAVGGFLDKVFSTEPQEEPGFFSGILRSTVGEQGATGLLKSIPRSITKGKLGEAGQLAKEEATKADTAMETSRLSEQLRTMPDGAEKDALKQEIRGRLQSQESNRTNVGAESREIDEAFPGKAGASGLERALEPIGQAINTALTVGSGGVGKAATLPGKMLQSGVLVGGFTLGDELQSEHRLDEIIKNTLGGAALGAAIPPAGKFVVKPLVGFMGNMIKGISASASGVMTKQIEAVLADPRAAKAMQSILKKSGGSKALRTMSRVIIEGTSTIKKESSRAFGSALEKLGTQRISVGNSRKIIEKMLQDAQVRMRDGKLDFALSEFADNPTAVRRMTAVIEKMR